MHDRDQLLSELLRPQQLSDLTLPQKDIDRLQRMVDSGSVMNMIFYGRPGLGKTSAARMIVNSIKCDSIELSGVSVDRSYERFVTTVSSFETPKLCFIDEAELLSKPLQATFRSQIEKYHKNCRFLFTVNHVEKLSDALPSRMKEVCFDISPRDRLEVINRLHERYERKLPELGIKFDPKRLTEIVGLCYPDLRSIANQIEYEFA